jgi:hypothetical protein
MRRIAYAILLSPLILGGQVDSRAVIGGPTVLDLPERLCYDQELTSYLLLRNVGEGIPMPRRRRIGCASYGVSHQKLATSEIILYRGVFS